MQLAQARQFGHLVCLAPFVFWAASALAQAKSLDEAMSYDGLQKINVKGLDLAYALPGATLAGYTQIIVEPVGVAFHKDWKPNSGSPGRVSAADQQKIRQNVAKVVHDAFVQELKAGGYTIVTAPGPNTLRVKANIINLYVTAPDVMSPGRSRVYTASAGEMTLLAELEDSESDAVIVRVIDRHQARNTGSFQLTTGVSNAAEVRTAASSWAKILRTSLDDAKTIGAQ
jgi:Protein of unknown function (DUF3313)